jgi:hypothetical protein
VVKRGCIQSIDIEKINWAAPPPLSKTTSLWKIIIIKISSHAARGKNSVALSSTSFLFFLKLAPKECV